MPQLSPELERRLTAAVDRMPAFPKSVQTILAMTRDSNCLPKQLVGVIEKDPVMTLRILRVINSAYYALPNKIGSVGQAVVYLGLNTIKNLALACAAAGALPRFHTDFFDSQQYLLHSLAVASLARLLCEKHTRSEADPGDCYVAGLLHDFGKVVFAHTMAAEFTLALGIAAQEGKPLYLAEQEVIGADHAFVGALLAKKWQFGEALVACIRDHHAADVAPQAMLDCLRMADAICRKQSIGAAGNPWREEEMAELPTRFGSDLDAVVAGFGDLNKHLAEAQTFAQIGIGERG
ncbi:HDOD domain-containing protein [Sulfuricystis multivorans]|uniref:HDOD domain-containing protein n=1 Tax=Sulfuricystis multivorans TaxID=2211108 RepID=UPI000F8348FE|nr:HDOD domain-containing protein [Sulfuricystis multivorans]